MRNEGLIGNGMNVIKISGDSRSGSGFDGCHENASSSKPKILASAFTFDRIAGGDCHHRHSGLVAVAGIGQSQAKGPGDTVHERAKAVDLGLGHVCHRQ